MPLRRFQLGPTVADENNYNVVLMDISFIIYCIKNLLVKVAVQILID